MLAGRGFQALFNLIQALRDHDKELAEWIDGINQAAVRGKIKTTKTEIGKIKIIIPDELDYEDFASSLMIKIAEVNKNPTGTTGIGSKLGKTERKGSFTRIFKTLCDYTLDVLENNLVNPTFEKIHPAVKIYQKDALEVEKDGKINHNNISHCVRLGLLRKAEKRSYELTGLGHLYKVGGIDFGTLIKNQLLTYAQATDNGLFYPYRLSLEFLLKVREISFIPFAYSLFSIQFNDNGTPDIETAVSVAQAIIQEYPSIAITSETNKAEILTELNEHHPTGFNYNDIWTDRTTTGNQFRYLGRHLQVYDDIIEFDFKTLKIKSDSDQKILDLLDKSKDAVDRKSYEEKIWIV